MDKDGMVYVRQCAQREAEIKELQAKLDKPITEHPDVQRLIIQVETLSQENKELKNKLTYIRKRYPEIDEMEQALKEPNDAG